MLSLKEKIWEHYNQKGYSFIPYVALGYPNWDICFEITVALMELGATSIEFGFPFSDSTADGPILQNVFNTVLKNNFQMKEAYNFLNRIRTKYPDVPFIAMGYSNIFYREQNYEKNFVALQKYNISDFVIPDVPYREQLYIINKYTLEKMKKPVHFVNFLTQTMTEKDIKPILSAHQSFLYLLSYKGVTGSKQKWSLRPYHSMIQYIKQQRSDLPLLVGFGISSKEQIDSVLKLAHGFIIGSYIYEIIKNNIDRTNSIAPNLYKQLEHILP